MPTLIRYRKHPTSAKHRVTDYPLIWGTREGEELSLEEVPSNTASQHGILPGTPTEVAQRLGIRPDLSLPALDANDNEVAIPDKWYRQWAEIFEYDVIAPVGEVQWLRDFVRGPERSDELPSTWSETKLAGDGSTHSHTLCSYKATVAVARGMAYVQRASSLVVMDKIQAGVGMVQRIAGISDFSGWRSVSTLPHERAEELYQPSDLYQLVDPRVYDPSTDADSDDPRGRTFTTSDFLDARGLTRL